MEHVVVVHFLQAEGDLEQAVATEVLRVLALVADLGHGALVHILEDDGNILSVVVHLDAFDQLVAV